MTNAAARRRCAHVPPVNRRPNSRAPPAPRAVLLLLLLKARPYLILTTGGYLTCNNNVIIFFFFKYSNRSTLIDGSVQCASARSLSHTGESRHTRRKHDRIHLLPAQLPPATKSCSVCGSLPCWPKHAHSSAPALCVYRSAVCHAGVVRLSVSTVNTLPWTLTQSVSRYAGL